MVMQGSMLEAGNAFDGQSEVQLECGDEVQSQVFIEETFQQAQCAQNSAMLAYMQNEFDDAIAFAASAKTNYELAKLSFITHNSLSEVPKTTHCDMVRIHTTVLNRPWSNKTIVRCPTRAQFFFYGTMVECIASVTVLSDMISSREKSNVLTLRANTAFAKNNEEMGNDLMWEVIFLYEKCHMLATLYNRRLTCIQYNRLSALLPKEQTNFSEEYENLELQNPPVLIAVEVVTRQAITNKHVQRIQHFSPDTKNRLFDSFCVYFETFRQESATCLEKEQIAKATDVASLPTHVSQNMFAFLVSSIQRDHTAAKTALFDRNHAVCNEMGLRGICKCEIALFVCTILCPTRVEMLARDLHFMKLYVCLNEKLQRASLHEHLARTAAHKNEVGNVLEHVITAIVYYDQHDQYGVVLNAMLNEMHSDIEVVIVHRDLYRRVKNTLVERKRALDLYQTARTRMLSHGAFESRMLLNRTHPGSLDATRGIESAMQEDHFLSSDVGL